MPDELTIPVTDVEVVPKARGAVSSHQKLAIAKMAVAGLPMETISQSVGRSKQIVSRLIQEDQEVLTEMELIQGRVMKTMALHHLDMMTKLDHARSVIDQGMNSQDIRIALDTSKWLIERTVPKEAQRVEVEFSGETKHTVQAAAINISGQLGDLVKSLNSTGANFENSLKTELPGPISMEAERNKGPN